MSLWKVLGGAAFGVSAAGGHYGYLKYKRTNNQNPTGTENAVVDNLSSGDLIFFRRSPFNYPISVGLAINFYQQTYHSSVDHCGVIVEDNIGRPFILELTPTGPLLTPYVKRITESLSDFIVLVPLRKTNGVDEISFRKNLFHFALSEKKNQTSSSAPLRSEALELYKGAVISVLSRPEEVSRAPSVEYVLTALCEAGVQFPEEKRRQVLCDEMMSGQYQPLPLSGEGQEGVGKSSGEEKKGRGMYRFGESIVVRSS